MPTWLGPLVSGSCPAKRALALYVEDELHAYRVPKRPQKQFINIGILHLGSKAQDKRGFALRLCEPWSKLLERALHRDYIWFLQGYSALYKEF